MRYFNSNFLVLVAGTAIIATFSTLFYLDVNRRIDAGDARVIGSITFKKRVAQRKYSRQVVWEDLQQTEPIYNNDTIRTGEKSEAVVKINDGSEFTLNENSMVLVSMGGDQLDIEFNQGSITANRDNVTGDDIKKLNIKTGGTTVSIDRSSVNISKEKGEELNLVVNKGDAVVKTGNVEKTVSVDQKAVVLLQSAQVSVVNQPIVLLSPSHDHYFVTGGDRETVTFSWKPVDARGDLFLEIGKNGVFGNDSIRTKVTGTEHALNITKGSYSWRVYLRDDASGKTETSDARRFTILRQESISLLSPADKTVFSYRAKPQMIHFRWTGSDIAAGYTLVMARDPDLKEVIRSLNLPGTSISTDTIEKGTYYWKVLAVSGVAAAVGAGESPMGSFTVVQRETVPPPEQVYPPDGRKISRKLLEKKKMEFSWKKNPEVGESEIEISRDAEFKNIYHKSVKKTAFLRLEKDIPTGTYYWRVTGKLEDASRTQPSAPWSFSIIQGGAIELVSPPDKGVIVPEGDDAASSVRFAWKRMDLDGSFTIQVARDGQFKEMVTEKQVAGYFAEIPLPKQGTYYWRVFMPDQDGSVLMKSPERTLTIEERLTPPGILEPANGKVVDMSSRKSLTFSWNMSAGADAYRLELFMVRKGREQRIVSRTLRGNTFDMRELNKLDESRFAWTLQAMDLDRDRVVRQSPVVKSYFDITLKTKLEKPVINVPKIIFAE